MSPAMERAPEPRRTSYVHTTSSSDGGGTVTPNDGLTIGLTSDGNNKRALHSIILILPISILIFIEALRHPDKSIKLPIIGLELEIKTLVPLLLLVISYMLYRALRYSRIVLWNILFLPSQVAKLAFDSNEAFKVESPPYNEAFDPMLAEFRYESRLIRTIARFAFMGFNIIRSLAIYGFIFAMLVYVALYLTKELPTVAAYINFDLADPHWPTDPTLCIDLLVLGLSTLLIGLAWTNAGITILAALLIFLILALRISGKLAHLAFPFIAALYSGPLLSPLRAMFRAAHDSLLRLREESRDRRLTKDKREYEGRANEFRCRPEFVQYHQRLELFRKVDEQSGLVRAIWRFICNDMDPGTMTESTWWPIIRKNGFVELLSCTRYLKAFTQHAPIEEVRKRYAELQPFVDIFNLRTDKPLSRAICGGDKLNSTERTKIAMDLRTWLSSIPPKQIELRKVVEEWNGFLKKLDREGRILSAKYDFDLERESETYFARPELANAGFKEAEPIRGSHDRRVVTHLLNILRLAGDATQARPTALGPTQTSGSVYNPPKVG